MKKSNRKLAPLLDVGSLVGAGIGLTERSKAGRRGECGQTESLKKCVDNDGNTYMLTTSAVISGSAAVSNA